MKKRIFIACFINAALLVFSNDAFYYLAGGNIIPAEIDQTNVEMVEEIIDIVLFDKYYMVTVNFIFYNNGENETLIVGFPYLLQKQGGSYSTKIFDFKTWVNDILIDHSDDKIEFNEKGLGELIVDHAFTKEVYFPSKSITRTKVEYKSEYGIAMYQMATYYYGSGRAWYNAIGKMTININNNLSKNNWIYDIQMPSVDYGQKPLNISIENYVNWINGNIQIVFYNIEPNERDTIAICFGNPLWDLGPRVFRPERFYYRTHLLENKSLKLLSINQLRLLRNVFYAFYGYNFKDDNLKSFYRNFDPEWYFINSEFNENMFTEMERNNINKIIEEERNR